MGVMEDSMAVAEQRRQSSGLVQKMLDQMSAQVRTLSDPSMVPNADGSLDAKPAMPTYTKPTATASAGATGENGRLADSQLVEVAPGQRLAVNAATAWRQMVDAAAAEGVTLGLTDAYRSYDEQVQTRATRGDQVATAEPGTSVHGEGRAVDANVSDPRVRAWLEANAGRFGWANPDWAKAEGKSHEPWHYEYGASR